MEIQRVAAAMGWVSYRDIGFRRKFKLCLKDSDMQSEGKMGEILGGGDTLEG